MCRTCVYIMIKGTVASGQSYYQLHDARMISKDNSA